MNNLQELLTKLNNIENIKSDIMNAIASYNYPIDNNFNNYANAVSNLTADATATADMIYGENNTAYVNKVKVSGALQDCSNITNQKFTDRLNIIHGINNFSANKANTNISTGTVSYKYLPEVDVTNICRIDGIRNFMVIENLNHFECYNKGNMCSTLNDSGVMYIGLGDTDFSNTTHITNMFKGCGQAVFNHTFNFGNVVNGRGAFNGCNRSSINVTNLYNIVDGWGMFQGIQRINFDNGSMPNLVDGSLMFKSINNLQYIELDVPNLQNASSMFAGVKSGRNIIIKNAVNIIDASRMFNSFCSSSPNMFVNWNTTNLVNTFAMFLNYNGGVISKEVGNGWNTSNIVNAANMFLNSAFIPYRGNQDITDFTWDTSNLADASHMFENMYFSRVRTLLFGTAVINGNPAGTNTYQMFQNCTYLNKISVINLISSNAIGMFSNCYNLSTINAINLVTDKTTGLYRMCADSIRLGTINNTDTWDCSSISTVYGMFDNCWGLGRGPVLPNLGNCTNFVRMFNTCYALTEVPEYDTSNATDMTNMFYQCTQLSNSAVQNIVNMCLKSNITDASKKSMSVVWRYANISNTRYQNRWDELTAAGWTY